MVLVKRAAYPGQDFDPAFKTIELISANPAYETRRFSGYKLENIKVEGRVVACYHRM
jgi:SOS-response transcriptional repressor LexA